MGGANGNQLGKATNYMGISIAFGILLGILIDNFVIGLVIGVAVGAALTSYKVTNR
nr:hypothetical protein [Anaerolineae bacterium]